MVSCWRLDCGGNRQTRGFARFLDDVNRESHQCCQTLWGGVSLTEPQRLTSIVLWCRQFIVASENRAIW